jgi:hypothetical protein
MALTVVQSEIPGLGHVYAPSGVGPFPAVALLHGSEGGLGWLAHRNAALLAAHGFLAVPFPYDCGGNFWVGGDIWNASLDQTELSIAGLRKHPSCNGKVGLYGWSRGAEHALLVTGLIASTSPSSAPDAIAVHAPPDRAQGAWRNLFYRHRETGEPIAPPPAWGFDEKREVAGASAWTWRGIAVEEGAPFGLEAYDGPILISVGDRDEMWSAEMASRLAAELEAAGRPAEFHAYAGQGHIPDPATWNVHMEQLLAFFERTLA